MPPPPTPINPQDYVQLANLQQHPTTPPQPQTQNNSNNSSNNNNSTPTWLYLLSTPAIAGALPEIIKMIKDAIANRKSDDDDPVKKLAYQQMIEAWQSWHELAKQTVASLAIGGTRSYAKGLEAYFKEFNKIKAKKDSEKLEEEEKSEEEEAMDPYKLLWEIYKRTQRIDEVDERTKRLEKRLAKKKKKAGTKQQATTEQQPQQQVTQPSLPPTPPPTEQQPQQQPSEGVFIQ